MAAPFGKFQSLMGFHVRCNMLSCSLPGLIILQFQSLMGFHVRCNSKEMPELELKV